MFVSDFIADHERGWCQRSGEAGVLQSYGMRMQREERVRHGEREARNAGPESLPTLPDPSAASEHKETAAEKTVSLTETTSVFSNNCSRITWHLNSSVLIPPISQFAASCAYYRSIIVLLYFNTNETFITDVGARRNSRRGSHRTVSASATATRAIRIA